MKTARLSPLVVAAVGVVLSLLALGLLIFLLIKPTQDKITAQQARLDLNAPGTTPEERQQGLTSNKKKAQTDLAKAKVKVLQTKMQWAQVEAALMPPFDVSDRSKAMRQLTFEFTHYLAPDLQRQLTLTKGVTSPTVFAMPAPPTSPNDPMIRSGVLQVPLGTVTVNGDFRRILTQFNNWQYSNRLVLVDGLALDGNSPYMQGSYNATLYIFPQNDTLLPLAASQSRGHGCRSGRRDRRRRLPRRFWRRRLPRRRTAWRLSRWRWGLSRRWLPRRTLRPAELGTKKIASSVLKAFSSGILRTGKTNGKRGICLHGMAQR